MGWLLPDIVVPQNNYRTQWSWPLAENIFMLLLLLLLLLPLLHEITLLKKSCSNVITQENMTSVLIMMNKTF
jgi:succinate dehydrogenase hydrophobic anchor subunit